MPGNQELRAINKPGPEVPITTRGIASALRPTDPAKQGDQTFICPNCRTPLVGKSTKTLAIYQQADPVAVLAAVVNGD